MRTFRTTVNCLTGVSPWNQGTETPGLSRKKGLSMSISGRKHAEQPDNDFPSWGDNFIPVVPVEHAAHTPETPFCEDPTCPCHEDEDAVEMVNEAYQGGLITTQDATDIVKGRKSW